MLVSLAPGSGDARDAIPQLVSIFEANPRAVVLLMPVGLTGEDPAVDELLGWTRPAGLRLSPLRDLAPFVASTRMAVVSAADDAQVPDLLKRIQRLFTGNFDFATLAQQAFSLSQANARLDARIKTTQARCGQLEQAVREQEQAVRERDRAVREREKVIGEQKDFIQEQDKFIRDQQISIHGWEKHCREVSEREQAAVMHSHAIEARLASAVMHSHAIEARLTSVTNGTCWALTQRLFRLRLRLFPRESFRERAGRFAMQCQRRLRRGLHSLRSQRRIYNTSDA